MPHCSNTGKPDCSALTAEEVFKFCEENYLKSFNIKRAQKKGKDPVAGQDGLKPEESGSEVSPLTALAPLHTLSLEGSPPPADVLFAGPSSKNPSQAGPSHTAPSHTAAPSHTHSVPYIKVPPLQCHWQPSPTNVTQQSDDGRSLADRFVALESKLEDIDRRLKVAGL